MQLLLAGAISGAAVGVFGFMIFGPLLATVPTTTRIRQHFNDPTNWVMVGLAISFTGQATCALLGLLLGAALWGSGDELAAGLGSPSWVYTASVLAVLGAAAGVTLLFVPMRWRRVALFTLLAAGCYGWMLPHLALA